MEEDVERNKMDKIELAEICQPALQPYNKLHCKFRKACKGSAYENKGYPVQALRIYYIRKWNYG